MIVAIVVILLLLLPILLGAMLLIPVAAMPMARPDDVQVYERRVSDFQSHLAGDTSPGEALPELDWREMLVIDAVLRQQQLSDLRAGDAERTAAQFVEKRTREDVRCEPGPPPDNVPACESVTITWYARISFDEVMSRLRFTADERDWATSMLETADFTALLNGS